MTTTRISDVVVPEIFGPYVQQLTQDKSRLIRSGAVTVSQPLSAALAGGGLTFNEPSFQDLDDVEENQSTDDPDQKSTPNKIGSATEIQVRLSRNNSWGSMNLTADLAGVDPMQAIANRVSDYWVRREQAIFVATMQGVFANNAKAPNENEFHVQNDMVYDISGTAFANGATNFSASAFIDTTATMGDSMEELKLIMVHSITYARMLKNNLIDFVADAVNPNATNVPTFLGRMVIVDDKMPHKDGVFESWLFGAGAIQIGNGSPKVPVEVESAPSSGNGAGGEILYSRKELVLHPAGHAFVATSAKGGPSNGSTVGNLANELSWRRVFKERKQIQIARLVTREY